MVDGISASGPAVKEAILRVSAASAADAAEGPGDTTGPCATACADIRKEVHEAVSRLESKGVRGLRVDFDSPGLAIVHLLHTTYHRVGLAISTFKVVGDVSVYFPSRNGSDQ